MLLTYKLEPGHLIHTEESCSLQRSALIETPHRNNNDVAISQNFAKTILEEMLQDQFARNMHTE